MIAQTFRLSWNAAANWMAQGSPAKLVQATYPGGTPDRSNRTGDYQTRAPLSQHEASRGGRRRRCCCCRCCR